MSNLKIGLTKIAKGLNTMFSPITKHLEGATKPGGSLHAPITGLAQIAHGVKHVFGKTEEQKRDALIENLLVALPTKKQDYAKQLLLNAYAYSAQENQPQTGGMPIEEFLALTRDIINFSSIDNFIGVQPMIGPVGLTYFMTFTQNAFNGNDEGKEASMRLEITKHTTSVGTRRCHARYTMEAAQDLAALDVDMGKELRRAIATQVASELDYEFISDMVHVASKQKAKGKISSNIASAANAMAHRNRRGAGNFAIVTAEVHQELLNDPNFVQCSYKDVIANIVQVGVLNKTINVFMPKTPIDKIGKALVGYKGVGEMDTGMTYNPYVPLMTSGIVIDPTTFNPQMTLMTRYGKCFVSEEVASNYYTIIK